ncbi:MULTISPECIES: hypothetical protein [Mycobacterium]|nr:hypothetical protein [Mycobacterium sp. WUMAC-025]MEE3754393.1 hypothetical protein [Mycobacterium intracellulare]
MQRIDYDLLGNVAMSDAQRRGSVVGACIWLFQTVRNLLFRLENFFGRASTYRDKERFGAILSQSAAAK